MTNTSLPIAKASSTRLRSPHAGRSRREGGPADRLVDLRDVPATMAQACDAELLEHGDNAQGAGYVRGEASARTCYEVMLGVMRPHVGPVSLLDFGCGTAGLLDHIEGHGIEGIEYTGLDLSKTALAMARTKHPGSRFVRADVLAEPGALGHYDYIHMNGVFHWRGELSEHEMTTYWKRLLSLLFDHCRVGLAFNSMSGHVDWRRDDLFHLSFDKMAAFVIEELSRHITIRADYGAYEYTTYIHREAFSGQP